jgi:HEAT repeat protein
MLKVLGRSRTYTVGDLVRIVAPLIRGEDIKTLREMLTRVDEVSRIAASWMLAKRWELAGDPDTRSALMAATRDESDTVRARAAEALGKLRVKEAVPMLVSLLRVWDSGVKASAAEAIGAIGDREGCAAVALAAKDMYRLDARWVRALGMHGGDEQLRMLLRFSRSDRWVDQRVGIDALGVCRRPEALERLLEIYRNDESAFQSHAALALASQGHAAVKALGTVKDLKSPKPSDRARAVYALSRIRSGTAAEKLVAALRDPAVRELAAFGLRRLAGGKDAGYDPKGAPAQRAAAAQRWLELVSEELRRGRSPKRPDGR